MTPYFFRIKSFLSYWLEAVDEHSLHSPFFFDLYVHHIKSLPDADRFRPIEALRHKLLRDHRIISVKDLGAHGKRDASRKISAIARKSLSSSRYSRLYYGLASAFGLRTIVELGTSFGINSLYLAETEGATVTTFEGAPAIADIAALTFEFSGKKNISMVTGNIDETLPAFLHGTPHIDFAFVDANHRYAPTVQYFQWLLKKVREKSIIVVDDIHYSAEMERAWNQIREHRLVYASADLYRCGIVFFDPSLNKQHVILQI